MCVADVFCFMPIRQAIYRLPFDICKPLQVSGEGAVWNEERLPTRKMKLTDRCWFLTESWLGLCSLYSLSLSLSICLSLSISLSLCLSVCLSRSLYVSLYTLSLSFSLSLSLSLSICLSLSISLSLCLSVCLSRSLYVSLSTSLSLSLSLSFSLSLSLSLFLSPCFFVSVSLIFSSQKKIHESNPRSVHACYWRMRPIRDRQEQWQLIEAMVWEGVCSISALRWLFSITSNLRPAYYSMEATRYIGCVSTEGWEHRS